MIRFGLLGCGAMGSEISKAFDKGVIRGELATVYDADTTKAQTLTKKLNNKPKIANSFNEMLSCTDYIIEAASQDAVREYAEQTIDAGKSLLIMSVGALMDEKLRIHLFSNAEKTGAKINIPSGAISGIDAALAAAVVGVDEVMITTTKPPKGLAGVKYLQEKGIDVESITTATVVFEGPASEAAKHFPKNINVAAALSLAAGKEAIVKIIADPKSTKNTHEITLKGIFGEITTRTANLPSPTNPKTSYLAMLSAIAVLKGVCESVKVGN